MRQFRTPLSQRSSETLRCQAAQYRRMAETARTLDVATGLLKVADQLEALVQTREPLGVDTQRKLLAH
jgi:hypothetical protein